MKTTSNRDERRAGAGPAVGANALLNLKLTAAGANYERAYKLIEKHNIEHLK